MALFNLKPPVAGIEYDTALKNGWLYKLLPPTSKVPLVMVRNPDVAPVNAAADSTPNLEPVTTALADNAVLGATETTKLVALPHGPRNPVCLDPGKHLVSRSRNLSPQHVS